MNRILGIDHVAITVSDLEAACRFYDRLFGAETHVNYAPHGKPLVRQIALGGALLSMKWSAAEVFMTAACAALCAALAAFSLSRLTGIGGHGGAAPDSSAAFEAALRPSTTAGL